MIFDAVYHSYYLTLHSWERWSWFCGLSADMQYSVKFSTDHAEGCKQDEHAGECVRSSAWTAGSVLTVGDVDGTVGSWFLSPRCFQEVQRHPSAKTRKSEIWLWQIMMDELQWYVNPVDAVLFLGKMEPDRMWPSGELKEITIGVPWSDLAKLPWDEVGGKPLGKIGRQHGSGIRIVHPQIEADKTRSPIHGWLMMGALLFNFSLLGNFVSLNYFNSLKILKRFFGRNVMSFAYCVFAYNLLGSPNPIWVSLPLRRPSVAREGTAEKFFQKNPVAKTWQRRGEVDRCLIGPLLISVVVFGSNKNCARIGIRAASPTNACRQGPVFFHFFPCESPLDFQQTSHENLTKIRLYTHDFDD